MLEAKTFRTANGYCHLLLDKIIFTNTAEPVEVNDLKESKGGVVRTLIYSIATGIFVAGAIVGFMTDDIYRALMCMVLAGLFTALVIRRSIYSDATVIYKSTITKIEYKPFIYTVQNPHFIVHYRNAKELSRKRSIVLGSRHSAANEEEIQNAMNIMEEEFG
jgi:hypothetical protein